MEINYELFERLDHIFCSVLLVVSAFVVVHLTFSNGNSIAVKTFIRKQSNRYWWFPLKPNNISYSRIFLVCASLFFLFIGRYKSSTVIFILAAFTDYLDGIIARKCDLVTPLGKKLDPLADKTLTIPFLFYFAFKGYLSGNLVIVIIFMEIIGQFTLRPIMDGCKISTQANYFGKIKTILMIILIILCLIQEIIYIFPSWLMTLFLWMCFIFTFLSFVTKMNKMRHVW